MMHQVWFDKKNNLVRINILGEFSSEDMDLFFQMVEEIYQNRNHRRVLCDASGFSGKLLDKKTRDRLKEKASEVNFEKIALVGLSPSARMLAKIVTGILGKTRDTGIFNNEKEAINWLNGDYGD